MPMCGAVWVGGSHLLMAWQQHSCTTGMQFSPATRLVNAIDMCQFYCILFSG
jgi:hypothetical protein